MAEGAIYRCESEQGVRFTDQPCPGAGETVEIRDSRVGRLDQNLPEPSAPAEDESPDPAETADAGTCRFINSTDLRRYLVREQVVQGMTRDQVRRAFGSPPETYPSPQEVWIYQTRYYGALYELTYVYFRDGCVDRVEYRKP